MDTQDPETRRRGVAIAYDSRHFHQNLRWKQPRH